MDISKKKVLFLSTILLTLIIVVSIVFIINKNDTNEIVSNPKREVNNNNFLTLMLEQSDGTYQESTSNTWPGDGYIFNSELSACQNGGELSWDSENNKVLLYSNKSDGCYVYFDLYNKPVINSINLGEVTNNSITITVSATNGTNPISNYYYIINDGTPVSSTSNTYTFSGLDSGTTYTIKVYVVDSEGYSSDTSSLNVETENPILLADWVVSQYNGVQGNNGIYYHTSSLANSAGDNSYRFAGADPNNYVCFGSNASTCSEDNLYRIIGVFNNEVKLVKNISIGNYSGSSNNTWSSSSIRSILNTTFMETINSMWQTKISTHTWKVGGMAHNSSYTAQEYYITEVGSSSSSTTDNMKIGLMYVSDYGYAASNNYWTTSLSTYSNEASSNWLANNFPGITISKVSSSSTLVFVFGTVGNNPIAVNRPDFTSDIYPSFYLTSNTQYASGSGTQSDPIRLVV